MIHTLMGVGLVNFFLGCALAEVYPSISRQTHRRLSAVTLLGLGAAGLLMVKNGVDNALGGQLPGIAFGLSPMILYASLSCPLLDRILSSRPMKALGNISISVFFWHMPVYEMILQIKGRLTGTELLTDPEYLGYLVLTLSVSYLSFRYLEKGFLRKKTGARETSGT